MQTIDTYIPDNAELLTTELDGGAAHVDSASHMWGERFFALARISIGWVFLWAFLDKVFGLGFATESSSSWLNGGSPTNGFLEFGTKGPFADLYQGIAGAVWADWLFMIGLLGIGIGLCFGVAMRLSAVSGALMLVLMWSAALAPENNPFMDDHLVYALALLGMAASGVGQTWGLGQWWRELDIVKRFPILR